MAKTKKEKVVKEKPEAKVKDFRFEVLVNGKRERVKMQPGCYVSINRKWKNGDVVEVKMPLCGFNEKMLTGLGKLHEGFIENLAKRLKKQGDN